MQSFKTARDAAYALRPDQPVYCFMPEVLARDALAFKSAFPGKTAYAVKTNGEPMVLKTLAKAGFDCFDVASPARVRGGPGGRAEGGAVLHPPGQGPVGYPPRARDLSESGCMALDHEDEVAKILRIVRGLDLDPEEITLLVRLASRGHAAYELSKKFGAAPAHAVELVQRIHRVGFKVGLCFHVGSQVEDTDTYERALASAAWVRSRAGVPIAMLDIGGGFPAEYGHDPRRSAPETPDTAALIAEVVGEIGEWGLDDLPLVAEPGRVIAARSFSLIVRVLLKKGRRIYINDGIWASLSEFVDREDHVAGAAPARPGAAEADRVARTRRLQGLRRHLRFRGHPVAALLPAAVCRYRGLDRDRAYRRLLAGAPYPVQWLLPRHLRRGQDTFRRCGAGGELRFARNHGGLTR